jgi:hypothetical protein
MSDLDDLRQSFDDATDVEEWLNMVLEPAVGLIVELETLIKWLSVTYGENDPVWMFEDPYGQPLDANRALHRTWMRVVRGVDVDAESDAT